MYVDDFFLVVVPPVGCAVAASNSFASILGAKCLKFSIRQVELTILQTAVMTSLYCKKNMGKEPEKDKLRGAKNVKLSRYIITTSLPQFVVITLRDSVY